MGLQKNFLGSSSSVMSYLTESCIKGEERERQREEKRLDKLCDAIKNQRENNSNNTPSINITINITPEQVESLSPEKLESLIQVAQNHIKYLSN